MNNILDNDIIKKSKLTKEMLNEIKKYINKEIKVFSFDIKNLEFESVFQKEVLIETSKIPYGEIKTYKDIAININKPKAYRAVGNALNKNPYPIIIPCHRVVGIKNRWGYAGKKEMKKALLEIEGVK